MSSSEEMFFLKIHKVHCLQNFSVHVTVLQSEADEITLIFLSSLFIEIVENYCEDMVTG